jgi:hypothetical protein
MPPAARGLGNLNVVGSGDDPRGAAAQQLVWPELEALVIGPGTAPTSRPKAAARAATRSEPERTPASTMMLVSESAESSRARCTNRSLVGAHPGGISLSRAPCAAMRSKSC